MWLLLVVMAREWIGTCRGRIVSCRNLWGNNIYVLMIIISLMYMLILIIKKYMILKFKCKKDFYIVIINSKIYLIF